MHAGKLMRIRTVFVEMTATPSILRRSLDSTLTCKDIVVIYNFKESLPSLLHNGKKYQCHPTLIYPHTVAFHHELPRPPSKVHAFDKGRDKTLDGDVCVCINFLSDPVLSVFVSRCLHPLLVSGFCCLSLPSNAEAAQILWLVLLPVSSCNLRLAQLFVQLKSRTCKTKGRVCSPWWKINITI